MKGSFGCLFLLGTPAWSGARGLLERSGSRRHNGARDSARPLAAALVIYQHRRRMHNYTTPIIVAALFIGTVLAISVGIKLRNQRGDWRRPGSRAGRPWHFHSCYRPCSLWPAGMRGEFAGLPFHFRYKYLELCLSTFSCTGLLVSHARMSTEARLAR